MGSCGQSPGNQIPDSPGVESADWPYPTPLHSPVSTRSARDPAAYPQNYMLGHILLLFFGGGLDRELFLSSLMGAALC